MQKKKEESKNSMEIPALRDKYRCHFLVNHSLMSMYTHKYTAKWISLHE